MYRIECEYKDGSAVSRELYADSDLGTAIRRYGKEGEQVGRLYKQVRLVKDGVILSTTVM